MLGTVGIPTILLVLLIALPFIDIRRERRLSRRPVAIVAFVLVVLSMGTLTYKGATAKEALALARRSDAVPSWAEQQGFAEGQRGRRGSEALRGLGLPAVPHLPRHRRRQPRRAGPQRDRRDRPGTRVLQVLRLQPGAVRQRGDAAVRRPRRREPEEARGLPRRVQGPEGLRAVRRLPRRDGRLRRAVRRPAAARARRRGLRGRARRLGRRGRGARDRALRRRDAARATSVLERFTGGAESVTVYGVERLQEPVRLRLGEGRRVRHLPVLDVDGRHARHRRDGEPDPPRRLGRAQGGAEARARPARDAALADPPERADDAAAGGRGDPLRRAGLLPRRLDRRRPRRLRRRADPRPARARADAYGTMGSRVGDR